MILFTIFAFCFGACIGSFLNVVILRVPLELSLWKKNSHCMSCNAPIPWYCNIPIFSYIILRGKCKDCKTKFSAQYLFVELLTGAIFAITFYYRFQEVVPFIMKGEWPTWVIARAAIFPWLADVTLLSSLLAMTWIDSRHFIIPFETTIPCFIIGLLITIFYPELHQCNSVWLALAEAGKAAALGAGLFLLVRWLGGLYFKREALGLGDVHLMIVLAMYMNWMNILLVIFLSAFIGSFGGISLKIILRKSNWRFEIPYGPYIAVGAVISYFWGSQILGWYLEFFAK